MKDNLEDLLNDILSDVDLDEQPKNQEENIELDDLLEDLLDGVELTDPEDDSVEEPLISEVSKAETVVEPSTMSVSDDPIVDFSSDDDFEDLELVEQEVLIEVKDEPQIVETVQSEVKTNQSNGDKTAKRSNKKSSKAKGKKEVVAQKDIENDLDVPIEPQPQKKRNYKIIWIPLLMILVAAITFGSWFVWDNYFNLKQIDIFEHYNVNYVGGKGNASIELILQETKDKTVQGLSKQIEFDYTDNLELNNGDEVLVSVKSTGGLASYLKNNKLKLKSYDHSYTVEGLVDASELLLFKDTEVVFSGIDGSGKAIIENNDFKSYTDEERQLLKSLVYKLDKTDNLKNGDKVSVSVIVDDAIQEELVILNLEISTFEKEILVSGLEASPLAIGDLQELEALKVEALSTAKSDYEQNVQKYGNFKIEYTCFTTHPTNKVNYTDNDDGYPYTNTSLMFIISVDRLTGSTGKPHFAENYGYTNMSLKDGLLDRSVLKKISPYQNFASINDVHTELVSNGFTCTKD